MTSNTSLQKNYVVVYSEPKRKTPQNNNVQEHKIREAGDGER